MTRSEFIAIAETLRNYGEWEKNLYALGIDLTGTPAMNLAESLECFMRNGDLNWSYDEKLEFDWIIEWCYTPDSPNFTQHRHGKDFDLTDAGALYDFLVFMNEHGWEAE
jgi:hypothetical protein